MHLAELGGQCPWRGHVAHLPAGHVVSLAETGHHEGPLGQAGKGGSADVCLIVEHHVLVDLVSDQQDVGGGQQGLQLQHLFARPDGGTGVVRRVHDDGAGAWRDRRRDEPEIRPEGARCQGHPDHGAARQFDVGYVAVVAGLQHDHLVAGVHAAQHRREDGLGGAGGDGDLGSRVVAAAVERLDLARHGLAQGQGAGHGRVLVETAAHGACHVLHQGRVAVEVREALTQIDRLVLSGQRGHDGEDVGAHLGQAGLESHGVMDGGHVFRGRKPVCRQPSGA